MKKYLLLSLAMAVALPAYAALDCATPPTCAELGYIQSEADCAGQFMLKCPFDNTKVFCGGEDCEAQGYIHESCGTYMNSEACPYDSSLFKCTEMTAAEKCAVDGYTVTSCASGYYASETCYFDSSYVKCAKDSCSLGYLPGSDEACACTYGSKTNGYTSKGGKACRTCCTSSETCTICAAFDITL